MKSTKTFLLVTIISLVSVFTISCTPETQNQPLPTNTFDVNLSVPSNYTYTDTAKTIFMDGDSIRFVLLSNPTFIIENLLLISVNVPNYEILKVKTYPFNLLTHAIDSTYFTRDMNSINSGVLINDSYTANTWDTLFYFNPSATVSFGSYDLSGKYATSPLVSLHSDVDGIPWYKYEMPENTDQYIVFRKRINSQYQYYWLRTRNETVYSSDSMNVTRTIKVLNGKYQMNSITTGQ